MEFNRITGMERKDESRKERKKKIHTKIIKLIKRIVISNKISSRIFPQLLKFARVCMYSVAYRGNVGRSLNI